MSLRWPWKHQVAGSCTETARTDRLRGPHRRERESRPWGGSGFTGGAQAQGHRAPRGKMSGAALARVEEPREGLGWGLLSGAAGFLGQPCGHLPRGVQPQGFPGFWFISCSWPFAMQTLLLASFCAARSDFIFNTVVKRIRLEKDFCDRVFAVWICILHTRL